MNDTLDLVRGLYDAFAAGDIPALLGRLAPEVRWCEAEGFPLAAGNPYVGADAILGGVFARLGEHWSEFRVEPAEFVGGGDVVTMFGRYKGRSHSGRPLDVQVAHTWWLQDGKVVRFQQMCDTGAVVASLAPAPRATAERAAGKATRRAPATKGRRKPAARKGKAARKAGTGAKAAARQRAPKRRGR